MIFLWGWGFVLAALVRGWPKHVSQRNRPLGWHLLSRYEGDRELYLFFIPRRGGHVVRPPLCRCNPQTGFVCLVLLGPGCSSKMETHTESKESGAGICCVIQQQHDVCVWSNCSVKEAEDVDPSRLSTVRLDVTQHQEIFI